MRQLAAILLLITLPALSFGQVRYKTANFLVSCDSDIDAKNIGAWAEKYRREWSKAWLGEEMAPWDRPCPVQISFRPGSGGVTSFQFMGDRIVQRMEMNGTGQDLCCNVLPHEITHTIFASHFRRPNVPRWADEGGATLSESIRSCDERKDRFVKGGHSWTLRQLFGMRDYPYAQHVQTFYAQSHCIVRFLVQKHGRKAFLKLVSVGMDSGWDRAVQTVGYNSVEELEKAWRANLKGSVEDVGSAPSGAVPAVRISKPTPPGVAPTSNGWDDLPQSGTPGVRDIDTPVVQPVQQPRQQMPRQMAQPYPAPPSIYIPRQGGGGSCPT